MSLLDRIRRWWRAEWSVEFFGPNIGTVTAKTTGALYEVFVDGVGISYTARWWDTRRSIARQLRKKMRQL